MEIIKSIFKKQHIKSVAIGVLITIFIDYGLDIEEFTKEWWITFMSLVIIFTLVRSDT